MTLGYVILYGKRGLRSGGNESTDLGKTDYGIPLSGHGLSGCALSVP
jgi:hypothetical protein